MARSDFPRDNRADIRDEAILGILGDVRNLKFRVLGIHCLVGKKLI